MSTDSQLFKQPSRIEIIGQNGNDGEHYKYAIQTLFSYGWDYIETSDDGLRTVYDTKEKAEQSLANELKFNPDEYHPDEWRVVVYNFLEDSEFARE